VIAALQALPGALEAYAAEAGAPLVLRPDAAAPEPSIEEVRHGP
jgi:hypothetical protein